MNLTELKKQVDRAYSYALDINESPDSIPVTLQLNRDGNEADSICTHEDVELFYDNNACASGCVITATIPKEPELLSLALRAICLTRDYVGERSLPPIKGWDWFDVGEAIAKAIPDDEWAKQFRSLTDMSCRCRLCYRDANHINGYLSRVNEKGVPGIWECRPSCDVIQSPDEALFQAINGD